MVEQRVMRRSLPIRFAALALAGSSVLAACGGDAATVVAATGEPSGEATPARIPAVLAADTSGRFTTLLACAQIAGLVSALEGTGPLTVFAPTNDAFKKAGVTCEADEKASDAKKELLTRTLLQHVVGADVALTAPAGFDPAKAPRGFVLVLSSTKVDSLLADAAATSLTVDASSRTVMRTGSTGTAAKLLGQIEAPNGYIQVIDSVIVPPSADKVPPTTALPKPFDK